MTHSLVSQLRFARSEFMRCLDGVTATDAQRRLPPMNCLSWMIGHLANQEQFYWVLVAQGKVVAPDLNNLVGFGKPASTPPLDEMLALWQAITETADPYLESIDEALLPTHLTFNNKQLAEPVGHMLLRNIYHYWFHTGEAHAVRQMLGHTNLPQFVGSLATVHF